MQGFNIDMQLPGGTGLFHPGEGLVVISCIENLYHAHRTKPIEPGGLTTSQFNVPH